MLSTKEVISFFRKNRKIASIILWTLVYRVSRLIKVYSRDNIFKRIKNSIIVSDVPGQNIVIISFDHGVADSCVQQLMYGAIRFICIRFGIGLDFVSVNDMNKAYIPKIVKQLIMKETNPEDWLVSDPPILLGRSYFYSYV